MDKYFRVPNNIFSLSLTASETLVLIYIMRCANNGVAFPSYATIARNCKVDRHTAIRCVRKLEGKYLNISRLRGQVNHYQLVTFTTQVLVTNTTHYKD